MISDYSLRPINRDDHQLIGNLLKQRDYIHRHLDWRTPLEWLGSQPFWLLEKNHRPAASLAFPIDPQGVAWIRLFCAVSGVSLSEAWKVLFAKGIESFSNEAFPVIASVATQAWYAEVLKKNDFKHHQDIVVLQWEQARPPVLTDQAEVTLHIMQPYDIEAVADVDQRSFENIWQNSRDGLKAAFYQAEYSTIAMYGNDIVGYQISTATPFNAHLARLAVLPEMQKRGIGRLLVVDMIRHFYKRGLSQITVNTQHDNHDSAAEDLDQP